VRAQPRAARLFRRQNRHSKNRRQYT
jgi:hypothetical protein